MRSTGFSIGFMAKSRETEDGGRILTELDLLEISATSTPMNATTTRALSWKAASAGLADADLWLPREATLTKAAPPSTIEEDIERMVEETRRYAPIHFETFEVG
jgi:hypothetical protein